MGLVNIPGWEERAHACEQTPQARVSYTSPKHVSKPRGAPLGAVGLKKELGTLLGPSLASRHCSLVSTHRCMLRVIGLCAPPAPLSRKPSVPPPLTLIKYFVFTYKGTGAPLQACRTMCPRS